MIDQHTSLSEKFIKKGFWLYLFSFIIGPMAYIIKIIISWELTVSEVWILYGIISLITMISAYNDLWMKESINHFVPDFVTNKRYDKVKSILTYALIAQVITWITIALFFFFWADFLATNYFKSDDAIWVLKIFSIYFLWINIFQIVSIFFMSVQSTFHNKLIDFFRMSFVLISILFIFFADLGSLINYSYSWIVWLYMWIIFSLFIFYKKYYSKYLKQEKIIWDKKLFKQIFKYASMVFIWAQAATILSQIDMQLIIYMLGTVDAGYYTNYLSIIWIPFIIIAPIFWLLFPVFSEMHSKWEHEKIRQVKKIFAKNFLAIWIAVNILFFIFAEKIAFILFWEKFIISWFILQYSILFLIFNFLFQINFFILAWIGKVKERVKIILIAIIFNLILNIILINLIWVYWAALATAFWWILIWVLSEIYLWKKYFVWFDYKFIAKNIISMTLLWLIAYNFILTLLEWIWRLNSLFIMIAISILWFACFISINLKEVKLFVLEIKKIRNK